jgi:glucose 1-dehydrogenase
VAVGYHEQAEAAGEVAEQVRSIGRRAIIVAGELAKADAADQLVAEVENELGPLDVLVANAGVVTQPWCAAATSATSRS